MVPKVLYEDESLFIVDKPAGWITNSSTTVTIQPVVQKWMEENFKYELAGNFNMRSGIVHRLDKETSGVLIVAKTEKAFRILQDEFRERTVKKTYTALLHGKVEPTEGKVEVKVGRLPWRRDRFGVLPDGRDSVSEYKVLKFYPEQRGGYSLVEFYPHTGRTHQIRIHAKHMGHAIVSDEFYAGRKTARNDRKFCPRLFLHATSIVFVHPVTGAEIKFDSKLPEDLQNTLILLDK